MFIGVLLLLLTGSRFSFLSDYYNCFTALCKRIYEIYQFFIFLLPNILYLGRLISFTYYGNLLYNIECSTRM
jgi:hypothetical protein